MYPSEKVAYLKGLMEGMDLDKDDKETKIFMAIADILEDLAIDLEEVAVDADDMAALVEEIDEDLGELEEIMMSQLEDDGHHHHGHHHHHHDHDHDECGCGGHHDHDHGPIYEMICPGCGEEIYLDEEMLMEGKMECPGCGELLEFGLEDDSDEKPEETTKE